MSKEYTGMPDSAIRSMILRMVRRQPVTTDMIVDRLAGRPRQGGAQTRAAKAWQAAMIDVAMATAELGEAGQIVRFRHTGDAQQNWWATPEYAEDMVRELSEDVAYARKQVAAGVTVAQLRAEYRRTSAGPPAAGMENKCPRK